MDIVEAVKKSIYPSVIDWAVRTSPDYFDDKAFCRTNGAITIDIAKKLGISCSEARPMLNKAVKDGLLVRSDPEPGRKITWWPAGYLRELKTPHAVR